MRLGAKLFCWVLVLLVGGCAEVIDEPDTAPLTVTVSCCARTGEGDRVPLEGVELCQLDALNCALTDADGVATIEVQADREIAYTLRKEGYMSYLVARVIPANGYQGVTNERTDSWAADMYDGLMTPYPERGTGSILVVVSLEGATLDLDNATGKPFYVDEEGRLSLGLTATTSYGQGGFVEVTPGVYEVKLGGTARSCVPTGAWPDVENSIRVPVREGHLTIAGVRCVRP